MNKFLKELKENLDNELSQDEIDRNLQFYKSYIEKEKTKGRKEKDILAELGNPLLIARSIIDANRISGQEDVTYVEENTQKYNSEYKSTEKQVNIKNKGCIILAIIFSIIVFFCIWIVSLIFKLIFSPVFLLFILVPIILIYMLFRRK